MSGAKPPNERCACGHLSTTHAGGTGLCDPSCGCAEFITMEAALKESTRRLVGYEDKEGKGYELTDKESAAYLNFRAAAQALMEAEKNKAKAEALYRKALDDLNRSVIA